MSSITKTTYFITGGNRGIGFNLVKTLSASPKNVVITSFRGTTSLHKNRQLCDLSKERANVHIVELDVADDQSISRIAENIKRIPSFDGIDVFIANSGIADASYEVLKAPKKLWLDHYATNALGPILVLQNIFPLLLLKKERKLFFISSIAGSITGFLPVSLSAYGQSKAALNYSVKELSFELEPEGFTVVAFHPGTVLTDMGRTALEKFEKEGGDLSNFEIITPEESAGKLLDVFGEISVEDNGKFYSYDGTEIAY